MSEEEKQPQDGDESEVEQEEWRRYGGDGDCLTGAVKVLLALVIVSAWIARTGGHAITRWWPV